MASHLELVAAQPFNYLFDTGTLDPTLFRRANDGRQTKLQAGEREEVRKIKEKIRKQGEE